jgi:hypothetical protein
VIAGSWAIPFSHLEDFGSDAEMSAAKATDASARRSGFAVEFHTANAISRRAQRAG